MGLRGSVQGLIKIVQKGLKYNEVNADPGAGFTTTSTHFGSSGEDAPPMPGDYALMVETEREGVYDTAGTIDLLNQRTAEPGEYRIYARDTLGGQVCEVFLKADGSISASNAAGHFNLQADGVFEVNGVTISPDGLIVTPTGIESPSVKAGGKELTDHTHPAGTPPGNTGANQ